MQGYSREYPHMPSLDWLMSSPSVADCALAAQVKWEMRSSVHHTLLGDGLDAAADDQFAAEDVLWVAVEAVP